MSAMAGWVGVGGTGVSLGFTVGIIVAEGGMGVLVRGTGLAVGGTGELVSTTATAVAVGGMGVGVGVGWGVLHEAIRSRAKRMEMNGLTDLDTGLLLSRAWLMDDCYSAVTAPVCVKLPIEIGG